VSTTGKESVGMEKLEWKREDGNGFFSDGSFLMVSHEWFLIGRETAVSIVMIYLS